MTRCYNCKNNRRQLISLHCKHDICIRCAADNYFLNCKNKLNGKSSSRNNYFCETCLEQTPLDLKTLEQLKKYFMDNIIIQEKHKQNRKDKLLQREHQQKQRLERLHRLEADCYKRPKSLQIEIDQQKKTLSKYLNDQHVEKFIEMQKQYGISRKDKHREDKVMTAKPKLKPQTHTMQSTHNNEYELKSSKQLEALIKRENANLLKQKYSDTDSFDRFADHQQLKNEYKRIKEYQNRKMNSQRQENHQKIKRQQQEEYQLYHNGKAVPNYNPKLADRILQHGKISENGSKSRNSSSSSARAIGKIKTKKAIYEIESGQNSISPVISKEQRLYLQKLNGQGRKERLMSAKSEQNGEKGNSCQVYPNKATSIEYQYKNNSSCVEWELQSIQTRRANQEKTAALAERSSETMQQILQTLQAKQEESIKNGQPPLVAKKGKEQEKKKEHQKSKLQSYFCKIHEDQEIIYFCLKCNQLICSECALHGTHQQHEIHSLKKSAQLLRQNLFHNMSTLNKMLIEEETKEKILKECINELNQQCSRHKQQIKSSFQNFIFTVDKKYKDLLKEIQEKFSIILVEYNDKLKESRNSYIQISQVKDDVSDTLQEYAQQAAISSETSSPAYNQLGNFHVKKQKNKVSHNQPGIQQINKLINTITVLSEFLKNTNEAFRSPKKVSLISESSSLKLSDSSNLLQDRGQFDFFTTVTTPTTNTPQRSLNETPKRRSKRIMMGGYGVNLKNRIKLFKCQSIVQSLLEMQQIVRVVKLEVVEYQVKALS